MAKPKLTPTFKDQLLAGGVLPGAQVGERKVPTVENPSLGPVYNIVAPHEPVPNEAFILPQSHTAASQPKAKTNGKKAPAEAKQGFKVCLMGTAPSSRNLAPFTDPDYKIWSCSPGNMDLPRVDEWFELHSNLLWPENQSYGIPYVEWLKKLKIPLWMQDQRLCPNAHAFPAQEMVNIYGAYFFTSSFSWMAAFAMERGATEILLFGIDMASRDEYIVQRAGFYYFLIEAERRGIKMGAPNESDIMQPPPLYGYHDASPFGRKMHSRKKEVGDRCIALEADIKAKHDQLMYLRGAHEDIDYNVNIWGGAQPLWKDTP